MFRTLIYPSSGACDYSVELPHWSYCSCFDVYWSLLTYSEELLSKDCGKGYDVPLFMVEGQGLKTGHLQ